MAHPIGPIANVPIVAVDTGANDAEVAIVESYQRAPTNMEPIPILVFCC